MNAGKMAYGALFCVVLPALLWVWARGASVNVGLPAIEAPIASGVLTAGGAVLMALGMLGLRVHGGGLPMNAFPPPRRAERGVYAWLDHPIYAGFCAVVAGVAVWCGSAAGLWLVTPAVIAGCVALTMGFESDDLARRLGARREPARLTLASASDARPGAWDRVSLVALVFLPWFVLYELIGHLPAGGAVSTATWVDRRVPLIGWTEALYAGTYVLGVVPALLLQSCRDLRRFEVAALWGMGAGFWLNVVVPGVFVPREFPAGSAWAWAHGLERLDGVAGRMAFPSFHVFWAVLGGWAMSRRGRGWAVAGMIAAVGASASCVTTGMHGVVDVAGGAVLGWLGLSYRRVWGVVLGGAQRVADAWREWRIGPVRVLVHAWYAALSAGVGFLVAQAAAGEDARPALAVMAAGALIGAGAWGQVFEGSGRLARPFGYYGSVLGACIAAAACGAAGWPVWPAVGGLAVAAPWVQAIGRLRCLVQGCCHGAPCGEGMGLRYHTERSRVCALAHLRGVTIHATPVYSIAANVALGGVLVRLHADGAGFALLTGVYVLGSSLSRFIEEHYRGEPQTRVIAGLRAYQWLAVVGTAAGAALTCVAPAAENPGEFVADADAWIGAAVCATAYGLAMGVDLPGSSRRLARLA